MAQYPGKRVRGQRSPFERRPRRGDRLRPPGPDVSESGFQRWVIAVAELMGWMVWWTPNSVGTNPGEPDLRLVRPPRVIFAELKTERGRLRTEQREAQDKLKMCPGVDVFVWRPSGWQAIMDELQR